MKETNVVVQVHCLQPRWINQENARYRLYINEDLITERTWVWGIDNYVEENLTVLVPTGVSNEIRIETIKEDRLHLAQFGLQNLYINTWPKPDHGGHRDTLSFIIE